MEETDGYPVLIAVDWGTSRFRAYLVNATAKVLGEVSSDEGIAAVRTGEFSQVLAARCGEWLDEYPKAAVLMAGMVGSRNGWKEVPYVVCPASEAELKAAVQRIEISSGRIAGIVPGLLYHEEGVPDVIRGEETLIVGTNSKSGLIVLPGTHSKWAKIAKGRILSFKTYMTGEFYGLLRQHSILRLLAREPEDRSGFRRGVAAAERKGGLLHQAFEARTAVLVSQMNGGQVGQFLSGLLIAHEVGSAAMEIDTDSKVIVVARGEVAQNYREVLEYFGIEADVRSPRHCFVAGMLHLVPDWLG
ncbi:MAG TPA: 2-dehydro-3-deoxygalactonokinase [Aestuariivirgaceae bacterium]|nr:2-dehydro-3-deoxygalactonokinase [Aestuariivirgaceae bacterium]